MILKTKEIICKILKTLELWVLWCSRAGHKPEAGGFCRYLTCDSIGGSAPKDVIWLTSDEL